jgi:hypothetical protein
LWEVAIKELSPDEIDYLQRGYAQGQSWKTVLINLEREAEQKREEWKGQRWQIARANKPPVIVREKIDRILFWVAKFIQIGDIAMQYDPGHASLPWAAVRFVLQVCMYCAVLCCTMLRRLGIFEKKSALMLWFVLGRRE